MPNLDKYLTIDDLMKAARKRVPKMFFDYADSGAYSEQTYRENTTDFEKIKLRQRVASIREPQSDPTSGPPFDAGGIAPFGSTGMQPNGEIMRRGGRAVRHSSHPRNGICSIAQSPRSRPSLWFQPMEPTGLLSG